MEDLALYREEGLCTEKPSFAWRSGFYMEKRALYGAAVLYMDEPGQGGSAPGTASHQFSCLQEQPQMKPSRGFWCYPQVCGPGSQFVADGVDSV